MHTPDLPDTHAQDAYWMRQALAAAQLAAAAGEVPVGAVVVRNGQLIASAHNAPISHHDPSAHAEILALRAAAKTLGNYRLDGCTLYVTLEPCAMCAGAAIHARVARVVYAVTEAQTGAAQSVLNLFAQPFNHHTRVCVLADAALAQQCSALLQTFFAQRRQQQRFLRQRIWPLRDNALRTPNARFDALPDEAMLGASHYINHLPSLDGLRLHYRDLCHCICEEEVSATKNHINSNIRGILLLLHDIGQWSYAFIQCAQVARQAGWRVIAPDLIGCGRSDKPKKPHWHSQQRHVAVLRELLEYSHATCTRTVLESADAAPSSICCHDHCHHSGDHNDDHNSDKSSDGNSGRTSSTAHPDHGMSHPTAAMATWHWAGWGWGCTLGQALQDSLLASPLSSSPSSPPSSSCRCVPTPSNQTSQPLPPSQPSSCASDAFHHLPTLRPAPANIWQWLQHDAATVHNAQHPAWSAPFPNAGHQAVLRWWRTQPHG